MTPSNLPASTVSLQRGFGFSQNWSNLTSNFYLMFRQASFLFSICRWEILFSASVQVMQTATDTSYEKRENIMPRTMLLQKIGFGLVALKLPNIFIWHSSIWQPSFCFLSGWKRKNRRQLSLLCTKAACSCTHSQVEVCILPRACKRNTSVPETLRINENNITEKKDQIWKLNSVWSLLSKCQLDSVVLNNWVSEREETQ